jgi:hypothetical protein
MELPGGDGMFTKRTLERAKAVHQRDRVVSHNYCLRISDFGERQMNEALVETENFEKAGVRVKRRHVSRTLTHACHKRTPLCRGRPVMMFVE